MTFDPSQLGMPLDEIGVILVDHGSRRDESNQMLLEVVEAYRQYSHWQIVEPAHMELAEPSIAVAFARCVQQGAKLIVVFPYFLSPGRHWNKDIPALAAEASTGCNNVSYFVTAPLGLNDLMMQIIDQRITHCLSHAAAGGSGCEICVESEGCEIIPSSKD